MSTTTTCILAVTGLPTPRGYRPATTAVTLSIPARRASVARGPCSQSPRSAAETPLLGVLGVLPPLARPMLSLWMPVALPSAVPVGPAELSREAMASSLCWSSLARVAHEVSDESGAVRRFDPPRRGLQASGVACEYFGTATTFAADAGLQTSLRMFTPSYLWRRAPVHVRFCVFHSL